MVHCHDINATDYGFTSKVSICLLWVVSTHSPYWNAAVRREFLICDCSRPRSGPSGSDPPGRNGRVALIEVPAGFRVEQPLE